MTYLNPKWYGCGERRGLGNGDYGSTLGSGNGDGYYHMLGHEFLYNGGMGYSFGSSSGSRIGRLAYMHPHEQMILEVKQCT